MQAAFVTTAPHQSSLVSVNAYWDALLLLQAALFLHQLERKNNVELLKKNTAVTFEKSNSDVNKKESLLMRRQLFSLLEDCFFVVFIVAREKKSPLIFITPAAGDWAPPRHVTRDITSFITTTTTTWHIEGMRRKWWPGRCSSQFIGRRQREVEDISRGANTTIINGRDWRVHDSRRRWWWYWRRLMSLLHWSTSPWWGRIRRGKSKPPLQLSPLPNQTPKFNVDQLHCTHQGKVVIEAAPKLQSFSSLQPEPANYSSSTSSFTLHRLSTL